MERLKLHIVVKVLEVCLSAECLNKIKNGLISGVSVLVVCVFSRDIPQELSSPLCGSVESSFSSWA